MSLLETVIVLVIAGLLIGGLLTGRSLVRQAELKAMLDQAEHFKSVHNLFEDRMGYMPGDFPGASQMWTGALNGNGDGRIQLAANEDLRYWHHLGLADMIDGEYAGLPLAPFRRVAGANIPESALSRVGWAQRDNRTDSAVYNRNGLYYQLEADRFVPMLSPREAYTLDAKVDDGKAATGWIFGRLFGTGVPSPSSCVDGPHTDPNAEYILTNDEPVCRLDFWILW
jgi:hypothetical protein